MSLKLFQNGKFFRSVPTQFLLSLHPWMYGYYTTHGYLMCNKLWTPY